MPAPSLKPVIWLGDSLRELKEFPAAVQDEMGYAIYLAQCGQKSRSGMATPKADIDLLKQRLKQATEISRKKAKRRLTQAAAAELLNRWSPEICPKFVYTFRTAFTATRLR